MIEKCNICGEYRLELTTDHIVPTGWGGKDIEINKQELCKKCHRLKTKIETMIKDKMYFNKIKIIKEEK